MSWGRFQGTINAEWIEEAGEDKRMRLLQTVFYTDPSGVQWTARKGLEFDGASIPRALWSLTGDPFTGDYRKAAVFHDQGYKDRARRRELVDEMFYNAMRCSGVGYFRAKKMYWAVRLFGPKW